MTHNIEEIEGIGPAYAGKLAAVGINTVEQLLERCATPKGRKEVEESTGIEHARILKWTNMADLFRISGVKEEYSELLEAAGVDTVKELKHRVPENLHAKMVETNESKKLVRQVPSLSQVQKWVEQAKTMEAKITY